MVKYYYIREKIWNKIADPFWSRIYGKEHYEVSIEIRHKVSVEIWSKIRPMVRNQMYAQSWFQMTEDLAW